jgi:hypothetical protein
MSPGHRPRTTLARTTRMLLALFAGAACAPMPRTYLVDRDALRCGAVLAPDGARSAERADWRVPKADDERLAASCREVGPLVLAAAPALADSAPADTLLVVSWNARAGVADFGALVDTLTARHGGRLPPVVFLLQETFRDEQRRNVARARKADVRDFAGAFGLSLFYAPSVRDDDAGTDRGSAILSSLPLSSLEAIELPLERRRRVVVAASVGGRRTAAAGGGCWRLRVVSAHFDPFLPRNGDAPPAFRRRRADPARALVEALGTASATVIGGNFDAPWKRQDAAVRTLYASFPTGRLAPPSEATHVLRTGNLQRFDQLDYLFFRLPGAEEAPRYEKLTRSRTDSEESFFESDHSPLLGRVPLVRLGTSCE